jgi:hypothetical protein
MKYTIILTGLLFSAGCGTVENALYDKVITTQPAITNYVQVPVTNFVYGLDGKTNPVIYKVTNPVIIPAYTLTNLADKPIIDDGIAITNSLPVPYAGVVGIIGSMLYGGYRLWRNKKAVDALVLGIEAGRKLLQTPELKPLDDKIVTALKQHQQVAGVLNMVSGIVNDITGDTTQTVSNNK